MKNFQDLVQEALKNVPEIDIYQLKEKIESEAVVLISKFFIFLRV